jgi:hypothetical protein
VKYCWSLILLLFLGCATSTIETRRQEKLSSYQSLPAATKALVDQGQIKVGMTTDAVYISWGQPSDIVQSEDQNGAVTTWLYYGSYLEEYRHWSYREVRGKDGTFLERYPESDYTPRNFLRAEINFVNGVVQSWRTLPSPQ